MLLDYEILKLIWWALVGILLIGFAITDGMDMGVGALLPFLGKTDSERRVIINAVAPHWDGNQVWLITAGGAIFAAWPAVYAASFSGFYLAMLLVLIALFFRPVGFDYRSKLTEKSWRTAWDWGLFAGGFIPALIFGVAFGNLIQGVPFHLDEFLRPHFDAQFLWALIILLNPFALLAGLISVGMLALHGGLWLQLRTEQSLADRVKPFIKYLAWFTVAAFALAGVWVAFGIEGYRVVSQPPLDALPNPLNKEVVREAGALYGHLWQLPGCHPGAAARLGHAFGGLVLLRERQPWLGLRDEQPRVDWHHLDCRAFDVPVHHAVFERPEVQPHRLGCGL